MNTRDCVLFAVLLNYALSSPVTSAHMEKKDVKVMKCIVEVITEAMSMPHPMSVSQECLDTLRRDERLISILRHQNFLKELQEVAIQGATERAQQVNAAETDHVTNTLEGSLRAETLPDQKLSQLAGDSVFPDQSMLFALKPAEGGISAEKRETEVENDVEQENARANSRRNEIGDKHAELKQDLEIEKQDLEKHISEPLNHEDEDEQEMGTVKQNTRSSLEREVEEEKARNEQEREDSAQAGTGGEKAKSKLGKSSEKEKKAAEKRVHGATAGETQQHNGKMEVRLGRKADKLAGKLATEKQMKEEEVSTAQGNSMLLEPPHHSKEDSEEEVQELQMMANKEPVERREEDGSGSRKAEDHEIESLAAIESELENVVQKLHDLRRG